MFQFLSAKKQITLSFKFFAHFYCNRLQAKVFLSFKMFMLVDQL